MARETKAPRRRRLKSEFAGRKHKQRHPGTKHRINKWGMLVNHRMSKAAKKRFKKRTPEKWAPFEKGHVPENKGQKMKPRVPKIRLNRWGTYVSIRMSEAAKKRFPITRTHPKWRPPFGKGGRELISPPDLEPELGELEEAVILPPSVGPVPSLPGVEVVSLEEFEERFPPSPVLPGPEEVPIKKKPSKLKKKPIKARPGSLTELRRARKTRLTAAIEFLDEDAKKEKALNLKTKSKVRKLTRIESEMAILQSVSKVKMGRKQLTKMMRLMGRKASEARHKLFQWVVNIDLSPQNVAKNLVRMMNLAKMMVVSIPSMLAVLKLFKLAAPFVAATYGSIVPTWLNYMLISLDPWIDMLDYKLAVAAIMVQAVNARITGSIPLGSLAKAFLLAGGLASLQRSIKEVGGIEIVDQQVWGASGPVYDGLIAAQETIQVVRKKLDETKKGFDELAESVFETGAFLSNVTANTSRELVLFTDTVASRKGPVVVAETALAVYGADATAAYIQNPAAAVATVKAAAAVVTKVTSAGAVAVRSAGRVALPRVASSLGLDARNRVRALKFLNEHAGFLVPGLGLIWGTIFQTAFR